MRADSPRRHGALRICTEPVSSGRGGLRGRLSPDSLRGAVVLVVGVALGAHTIESSEDDVSIVTDNAIGEAAVAPTAGEGILLCSFEPLSLGKDCDDGARPNAIPSADVVSAHGREGNLTRRRWLSVVVQRLYPAATTLGLNTQPEGVAP